MGITVFEPENKLETLMQAAAKDPGLAQMEWAGNIRELRNMMSRLTLSDCGSLIDAAAVTALADQPRSDQRGREKRPVELASGDRLKTSLQDIQRAQILATYAETGNNVSKTARRLGVSRNMIYRTLRDGPG